MPLTSEIRQIDSFRFVKPLRAIFSGSSQSGKSYLIGEILENQEKLFGDSFTFVKYFYPTYLEESPVDYHTKTDTPVAYEAGFPTREHIIALPKNSLLVIDDQAVKAVKSDLIGQLFKVISGKRNISVILVTQNYFTPGHYSRDIRNSANYVALFRNCADAGLNRRVAKAFGLKEAYNSAERDTYSTLVYPYIFIDQSQQAQLSNYRVYVDIFGDCKIAYSTTGMKGYVLTEKDFLSAYKIIADKKLFVIAARKYEDKKRQISESTSSSTTQQKTSFDSPKRRKESKKTKKKHKQRREKLESQSQSGNEYAANL